MAKRKITVTVDQELVDFVQGAGGDSLSAVVNAALAHEVERRSRHAALGELLAHWEEIAGPVPDEAMAKARAVFDELEISRVGAA